MWSATGSKRRTISWLSSAGMIPMTSGSGTSAPPCLPACALDALPPPHPATTAGTSKSAHTNVRNRDAFFILRTSGPSL